MEFIEKCLDAVQNLSKREKEYLKCKNDIVHFAENHFKVYGASGKYEHIKLYPCQKGALYNFQSNNRFILNATRQTGKTLISMIFIAHSLIFNDNLTIAFITQKIDNSAGVLQTLRYNLGKLLTTNNKLDLQLLNGSRLIFPFQQFRDYVILRWTY